MTLNAFRQLSWISNRLISILRDDQPFFIDEVVDFPKRVHLGLLAFVAGEIRLRPGNDVLVALFVNLRRFNVLKDIFTVTFLGFVGRHANTFGKS